MNETTFFNGLIVAWLVLAVAVMVLLFFVPAPYGRHTRDGWGPRMNRRVGWILMESPAALLFAVFFLVSDHALDIVPVCFLVMWEIHYINRSFVFPFRMRGGDHNITVLPVAMAILFNSVNAYLNGRYLFTLAHPYPDQWLWDGRFISGALLFFAGMAINQHSDRVLFRLRKDRTDRYAVPQDGLFRYVSSPNYLGEILEWTGWALATWSLAGLVFAAWTAANLVPRAWVNHKWYKKTFVDYPPGRKALVPFLF